MIFELVLFLLGILGFAVLYVVLAHLSARMGEGMHISGYYLLYYIAILVLILILPAGWSIYYAGERGLENSLFALLTLGNIVAIAASFKYWWWLKKEILGNKYKGGESDG